jgi:hypothetical protein
VEQSAKTKKLLSLFMRRLTNLSTNNRSLFLPRLSDQFLDVRLLSQLNGENAFTIVEAMIAGKKKNICPVTDSRIAGANEASQKLKKLNRVDEFIFEEAGSHDLHIGWPFLHGKFADGTLVRAPLVFFPVKLEADETTWHIMPRKESDSSLNKSFLLGHSFYNQVSLDEKLMDETLEGFPGDSISFRTELYKLLQQSNIDLHFNSGNFYKNELSKFISFTKKEFESAYREGELKVIPEAVLGIFPQAGSSLVPDYLHLLEEASFQDLEGFFFKSENKYHGVKNFIPLVKEDKVYSIFPADSWQENALKAVKLGNSLVVEGPPGTGKSQLICNLVSDSIANGKRVLVVSQKRAALDVVFKRLASKNLGEFCSLVHDFKNDRKEIFEKLARQIGRTEEYKSKNISLDSIQLDRAFFQASHQIDLLTEELEHFRALLFDSADCGASIKELYLQSNPSENYISIKQEYHLFRFHELNDFLRKMNLYVNLAALINSDSHPWKKRKSFARLMPSELARIENAITEVVGFTTQISEDSKNKFGIQCDWDDLVSLASSYEDIKMMGQLVKNEELLTYFQRISQAPQQEVSSLWLANIERMVLDCFERDGPESSLTSNQLGAFQKALHRSMKSRRSLIGLIRWQLFSKDKVLITRTLVANKINNDKKGFHRLERMLDSRLNVEHNFSKLKAASWIQNAPASLDVANIKAWFLKQQAAIKSVEIYYSNRALQKIVNPAKTDFVKFSDQIHQLLAWLPSIQSKMNEWQNYLTPLQIAEIAHRKELAGDLIYWLKKDYDTLCEFDLQEESLAEHEKLVIEKLHEKIHTWRSDAFRTVFINSLSLAWIDHLEQKHPELRMASSGKIKTIEEALRQHLAEKENLSEKILLLRARERITDNLEFNRLNNQVTYRDLLHQVTKKKKIWPLRKVLGEFEEEVFKLTPCWLASPEAVSSLFQMREIFDIVIFDEASQCFAERGIPALYRGKQAVIAGDPKQLRPGDFYLARWQEDDFDEPDAEVDSLLDLASRYLMKVQLNEHYRSQSWQLIQFSNKNFYGGRLQTLPHFDLLKENYCAIDYMKVDGHWENNCNEEEARAVVAQLKKIWQENPEKEIGIVTFNAQQQSLIRDLLDEDSELLSRQKNFFVKNIENVQGDERDVIIFSIGYAPDKYGKLNAQFGSLNQDGGENRLNVAVTRAREKIIIVASIWPQQLQVDDTRNRGPKLLKEYLAFALSVANREEAGENQNEFDQPASDLRNSIQKENGNEEFSFHCTYHFADAVIYKKANAVAALLTDDNHYMQSLSCKEAHAHLPHMLEVRKWPYVRVYSRNFWIDRRRFFSDMENSL